MKPGDEGGWLPSMCFLRFRRRRKQHPNKSAAMARTANGTPTPIPIFSPLVRPDSLDAGATGSAEALGVADGVEIGDEFGAEERNVESVLAVEEIDDAGDDSDEDVELNVSLDTLLDDAVGVDVIPELSDPSNDDPVFEACDRLVTDGSPVTDAVISVCTASVSGGAAVAGPNSSIK